MFERHGVTPKEANEALSDPARLVISPDPASKSGRSVRTIGFAPSTERVITVITVVEDGKLYGVNGWPANDVDQRKYNDFTPGDAND